MIKTAVILLLVIVMAVVAFLTRPSQADFAAYIQANAGGGGGMSLKGLVGSFQADSYLKSTLFHDRLLWTSVEKHGQTQYTGAFGHWFKNSAAQPAG
jgi:hypothetical protein